MSSTPEMGQKLRDHIIAQPDIILEDKDLMRALVAANERAMGDNIVDLRGIAMARLEARLDRLEDTHQCVIAAAYENLAGANQIHRAILKLLEPDDLEGFLGALTGDVATILRVDAARLVLESELNDIDPAEANVLTLTEPGFIKAYLTGGKKKPARQITLRQVPGGEARIYGGDAGRIRSEACLQLDLGNGRWPGLLVLGSYETAQFSPQQSTDFLEFFTGVFERALRRCLP